MGRSRVFAVIAAWGVVVALLPGCASHGGHPNADPSATVGPILPQSLTDLLVPSGHLSAEPGDPLVEQDLRQALFVSADPSTCFGAVGFGGQKLFPDGDANRVVRTQADQDQHQLLEASAVYPSSFDAARLLETVRTTVNACQFPVTSTDGAGHVARVQPSPLTDPQSSHIVTWSTSLTDVQWLCDFAVVAEANAMSELVTCSYDHKPNVLALARQRLETIERLMQLRV